MAIFTHCQVCDKETLNLTFNDETDQMACESCSGERPDFVHIMKTCWQCGKICPITEKCTRCNDSTETFENKSLTITKRCWQCGKICPITEKCSSCYTVAIKRCPKHNTVVSIDAECAQCMSSELNFSELAHMLVNLDPDHVWEDAFCDHAGSINYSQ